MNNMEKVDYEKLSSCLNNIFILLEKEDSFLLRNIYNISRINYSYLDFIKKYNLSNVYKENNLTYNGVYLLAREIIANIDSNYLEEYDKLIKTGMLDFSYNNKYYGSHFYHSSDIDLININRNFNYSDVITLVHEFIHYTNSKNKSINRHLLTEFLSIYFELYATNYLINKGISKEEIDYNERLRSTKGSCNFFCSYEVIILAYEKFGTIDENTIKYLNRYYPNIIITKDNFDRECNNLLKNYDKIENQYKQEILYEQEFNQMELIDEKIIPQFDAYRYVLGTIIAYYSIKYCNMKDIIYLNNHINDYNMANTDVLDLLRSIGIDLTDANFLNRTFTSIDEYINDYNNEKVGSI